MAELGGAPPSLQYARSGPCAVGSATLEKSREARVDLSNLGEGKGPALGGEPRAHAGLMRPMLRERVCV